MHKLFLIFLLLTFTGCVAPQYGHRSYVAPDMPVFSVEDVAADIVNAIETNYPAGRTTFLLAVGDVIFNQHLEDKLRAKGFSIISDSTGDGELVVAALTLVYKIDRLFEEHHCYVNVTLSDGFIYSRTYQLAGGGFQPALEMQGRK